MNDGISNNLNFAHFSRFNWTKIALSGWNWEMVVKCCVIAIWRLLKRHFKAKRRSPAYSRALRQIRGVAQSLRLASMEGSEPVARGSEKAE